jgi:hypothetical protein
MGGAHKFAGIFPAGIKDEHKKVPVFVYIKASQDPTHLFLDPWFLQHGAEVVTDGEMINRMRNIPIAIGLGSGLINPAIPFAAAFGRACISLIHAAPHAQSIYDYFQALADTPIAVVRFDPNFATTINIDNGVFVYPELVSSQPQDFKDPVCPEFDDPILQWQKVYYKRSPDYKVSQFIRAFLLHLQCPISVKISNSMGGILEFDQMTGSFSGNLPSIGVSVPMEDNTNILDFVILDKKFFVDIKAISNGELSVALVNPKNTAIAFYKEIQLVKNGRYTMNVTDTNKFPPLIGIGGVTTPPQIKFVTKPSPFLFLLLD